MPKRWEYRPCDLDDALSADLAERLSVSPLIVRLMAKRGHLDADSMQGYLSPGLRLLSPLEAHHGLEAAAAVTADAVASGKTICIWGDYDVDGVTATALLSRFFRDRGCRVMHKLPQRLRDGYGLNKDGLAELAGQGVEVVLTVDCGVTSIEEVAFARELGMQMVVTDHHLPGSRLPPADAIFNPRIGASPCPDLAGVGAAFLLAAAVNKRLPGPPVDVRQYLDLVALGSVADVVKLVGENRILVKNGLLLIAEGKRAGMSALKEVCGFGAKEAVGAGQIGFGLAPRINAAGRLGNAEDALRLLLTDDMDEARSLAKQLDDMNAKRRSIEDGILRDALEQVEQDRDRSAFVLESPDWHTGVVGIVASRVVEATYRPSLLLATENGLLKGSGRGIPEFDLFTALQNCASHLAGFGGHRQAAGLSLAPENLDAFRQAFQAEADKQFGDTPPAPTLRLEEELPLDQVNYTLLKELEMLQPFGPGNPEPVFDSGPVRVRSHRTFGANHARLGLTAESDAGPGVTFAAKAWRQADTMPTDLSGRRIRVAYTPKIDAWSGTPTIELRVKDWREAE